MLALIAVSLSLIGCQRDTPHFGTPAPTGSSVQIASVSPPITQSLRVGESVKMKVDVNYALTDESGTVALVVQAADNSSIASTMEVVAKGSGTLSLETNFVVPTTKAIQIFTPLSGQGQSSTSTVDSRAFKVVAN